MEKLLLLTVFVPIIGSLLLPILGRFSRLLRNLAGLSLVLFSFLSSLVLLPFVASGKQVITGMGFPMGANFILHADGLAVFMALVASFIGAVIVLYSFDYVSHYDHQDEYYTMVVLFLGSMMGIVYSANLIFLFLFWEITAIASWRLIGFYRGKQHVLKADKAFLLTVFGALIMLLGFFVVFSQNGSFDLPVLRSGHLSNLAAFLILIGILSKSATLPFHTWLPDAGVAPSPVTALLHAAVLVKIGVYVFARLFLATFNVDFLWYTVVPVIAGVSALVSAGAALVETDIKRIIAYSTVSQIGFIFLGLSTGNLIGVVGGLLYILMHGLAKGGLFLSAGIVEQNTKTKDITQMGGLLKSMPFTALAFLFCAFSIMGVPPFGGFFSKYLVIYGAVASRQYLLAAVFILGAFMTILYLLRIFNLVFLGEPKQGLCPEKSSLMVFCVVLLAMLSLAGGIFISVPAGFLQTTASQFAGIMR